MNTVRPCGCKGVRTCLQCENVYSIEKPSLYSELQKLEAWSYCPPCDRIYRCWNTAKVRAGHETHRKEEGRTIPGVMVKENFLSVAEGEKLLYDLDTLPWTTSQSGRRKQNFGPKTNFKKRKLQNGNFAGFPAFSEYVQHRFNSIQMLQGFQTIEQCSLEYDPTKGASIDPHIDDCWIWGERVVTVNCLGDSVLTLTTYEPKQQSKYNLDLVAQYEQRLELPLLNQQELEEYRQIVIRVPMPNLSLILLYGPARYQFEHSVLRDDITERRVCLAYREFTPMYIDGESKEKADMVRNNANIFWKNLPINVEV